MIHNYNKPSELLARQKQTGESYWDMIGNPLPDFKTASFQLRFVYNINKALIISNGKTKQ